MRKQTFDRTKKIVAILLAIFFVISITATSVSAASSDNSGNGNENGNENEGGHCGQGHCDYRNGHHYKSTVTKGTVTTDTGSGSCNAKGNP